MGKSSQVHLRIETRLKSEAEQMLHELGITPTQAMTMFYKAIAREHMIPLVLKIPNKETEKVFQDTDAGKNLHKSKNAKDLFNQLDLDD